MDIIERWANYFRTFLHVLLQLTRFVASLSSSSMTKVSLVATLVWQRLIWRSMRFSLMMMKRFVK